MPQFIGFSATQLQQVQDAHAEARRILKKFQDDLFTDPGMKRFGELFPVYFGGGATQKVKRPLIKVLLGKRQATTATIDDDAVSEWVSLLLRITSSMLLEVDQNNFRVSYGGGAKADNADMTHDKAGRDGLSKLSPGQHVIEFIRNYVANDVPTGADFPEMTFFTHPFGGRRIQSQVQIYLHELSHHAGGTRDVKYPGDSSQKCYEFDGVLAAAAIGPNKAIFNAENVAMFLMEFS
jgi:hypothetical protein